MEVMEWEEHRVIDWSRNFRTSLWKGNYDLFTHWAAVRARICKRQTRCVYCHLYAKWGGIRSSMSKGTRTLLHFSGWCLIPAEFYQKLCNYYRDKRSMSENFADDEGISRSCEWKISHHRLSFVFNFNKNYYPNFI